MADRRFIGIKRIPKPNGKTAWVWAASQISRRARGFAPKTECLWADYGDPVANELDRIAARCEELTHDLRNWLGKPSSVAFPSAEGRIYFIRRGDEIKIGFSTNPRARLSDLQVANAESLTLIGVMVGPPQLEDDLHQRFDALHIRGEWFRAEPSLLKFIDHVAAPGLWSTAVRMGRPLAVVDGPECFD
jgi:hypothetical protein